MIEGPLRRVRQPRHPRAAAQPGVQAHGEGESVLLWEPVAAPDAGAAEERTTLEVSEGVTQQFAIRYLNMFNKAAPLTTFTRLCLHNEQPLVVEYKIDNLGVLKYYLAPKISDDQ